MDLYIKDIQQAKYQLMSSKKTVLSMSYYRLTFDPIQYLDLQANPRITIPG